MSLAAPIWIVLIPLIGAGGWWLHRRAGARRTAIALPTAELIDGLPHTLRERARPLVTICRLVAVAALAIACAGPEMLARTESSEVRGIDVLFQIDVSRSMSAEDLAPSRLGAAARVAQALVKRRPRDRFGVMTFAGDVQANCPLTLDHAAVLTSLRQVSGDRRESGTALGAAVAHAANSLRRGGSSGRVVLLLTDGGQNAGAVDAREAAAAAGAFGVRIYAVGIGSTEPAPFSTEFGRVLVPLDLDEGTLQQVAAASNGRYFRATDDRALDRISRDFDALEPTGHLVRNVMRPVSVSYAFAIAAIAALTLELILAATVSRSIP